MKRPLLHWPYLLLAASAAALLVLPSVWSERDALDYTAAGLEGLSRSMTQTLEGVENLSYQWLANADLNKVLVEYVSDAELYDISIPGRVFSNYIEGQVRALPAVEDAVFLDLSEPRRKPLTVREDLPVSFVKGLRDTEVVKAAVAAGGRAVWAGPFVVAERRERLLASARLIRSPVGLGLGVLVVFL
ncbi:MAG: hypothetical protein JNG85_01115, partial [Spirochaetaceae bacterium]|nr:hypothetical protein [Spirochaetaceae bacterium]